MVFEHDRRYKRIFSHPYFLQKLLESFVNESFISALDFSTLERIDKSFINEDFQEKESDFIFTIKFKDKTVFIFLLLEFQSTVDRLMPVRFLRYIMELYESFSKVPLGGKFPAVFPLLLYSGDAGWNAKEEIGTLIEKSIPIEYIPRFRYYPILENRISKKSLEKIKNAVAAIFYIENSSPEELKQEIDVIIKIISKENLSIVKEFAGWFNNYLASLSGNVDKEDISQKLENIMGVGTMFATKLKEHDEKLLKQGKMEGIEQGIEQGMQQGLYQSAKGMKKACISVEIICKATGLTKEEIEKI